MKSTQPFTLESDMEIVSRTFDSTIRERPGVGIGRASLATMSGFAGPSLGWIGLAAT
jgi:hypothetical protein